MNLASSVTHRASALCRKPAPTLAAAAIFTFNNSRSLLANSPQIHFQGHSQRRHVRQRIRSYSTGARPPATSPPPVKQAAEPPAENEVPKSAVNVKESLFSQFGTILSNIYPLKRMPLGDMEKEANNELHRTDPVFQREYFKSLDQSGQFSTIIQRFETQPQLDSIPQEQRKEFVKTLQTDAGLVSYYVMALAREGRYDVLNEKIAALLAQSGFNIQAAGQKSGRDASMLLGSSNFTVQTDMKAWENLMAKNADNNNNAQGAQGGQGAQSTVPPAASSSAPDSIPPSTVATSTVPPAFPTIPPIQQPIPVVISEVWSWGKFIRQTSTAVIILVAFMFAMQLLLDQQAKSGMTDTTLNASDKSGDSPDKIVKFEDVQGVDEAKAELEEVVQFLREPEKFRTTGGKLPKGVLLYGPPGTGKTHLARAIAGEAGVPVFIMSGSEFDEMFVGVGARRVRELFATARKSAPCIVFIDEIDAVGSKRSSRDQGYMRQTLNQLLVELDGFSSSENVIFIGATNAPESLDKALIRPGRFDRHVAVPLPDVKGRAKILEIHSRRVVMAPNVDLHTIARGTPGFSGADLANLVNQAALQASKRGASQVTIEDLEWAKDKTLMGAERKSAVITERSKKLTACHEAGHALVALYTEGATPLHKVTIIPRGNALGLTVQLPEHDQHNHTRKELLAMLDVAMGGRVAEQVYYGEDEVTTGASNDLEKATNVARKMVMHFGMSSLGLMSIREDDLEKLSPQTRMAIEAEIQKLLKESYNRAMNLLTKHKVELDRLSNALIENETLEVDEVKQVIQGKSLVSSLPTSSPSVTTQTVVSPKPILGTTNRPAIAA